MSVTLLPRYSIPGYEHLDPYEAAERLHRKKNRPERPGADDIEFPSRESLTAEAREYPKAMYRAWTDEEKDRAMVRAARQQLRNLKDPIDYDEMEAYVGACNSEVAQNALHEQALRQSGWALTHAEAKQIAFEAHRSTFADAAVSNTTDRRTMSAAALAERDAKEDAASDHIAEIPREPIGPKGRK